MMENIEEAKGFPLSESVMMKLVEKGMGRQEAHELVRKCSMKAIDEGKKFEESLMENDKIRRLLTNKEIREALDPKKYIGHAMKVVDMVVKESV
jgi:adenylosuccinate lyase